MDRLTAWAAGVFVAAGLASVAGCAGTKHVTLLDGSRAARFVPVEQGFLARARLLRSALVGSTCAPVPASATIVERIGVAGRSLTFRNGDFLYACDAGTDPAGEQAPPWCGSSTGKLVAGRLLDPRLDVRCRTEDGRPLAYAWIEPAESARWIGVAQNGFVEVYDVVGGLPVRVASSENVDPGGRATFDVTHYAGDGTPLIRETLEAGVAG